jgi:hypothetical protein
VRRLCLCLAYLLFLATSVESRMQNAKYKCVRQRISHFGLMVQGSRIRLRLYVRVRGLQTPPICTLKDVHVHQGFTWEKPGP